MPLARSQRKACFLISSSQPKSRSMEPHDVEACAGLGARGVKLAKFKAATCMKNPSLPAPASGELRINARLIQEHSVNGTSWDSFASCASHLCPRS